MKNKLYLSYLIILCISCLLTTRIFSQDYTNLRTERRHAISANLGYGLGLSYDVFINAHLNLEASASLLPFGFHGGIYYYPFKFKKSKRWTTYFGAKYGDGYFGIFNIYRYRSLYIPLGAHYINGKGLNLSADIGILSITEDEPFFATWSHKSIAPMINIKIGYRFGTMKTPRSVKKERLKNEKRNYDIRAKRKIGLYLMGQTPYTNNIAYRNISIQFFLTEQLNFELTTPLKFNGLGGGIQFHPWGKRKEMLASPYIGLSYVWLKEEWLNTEGETVAFSIPVGINYTNTSGISLACFVAYGVSDYVGYDYSFKFYEETKQKNHKEKAFVGLKIGFRF